MASDYYKHLYLTNLMKEREYYSKRRDTSEVRKIDNELQRRKEQRESYILQEKRAKRRSMNWQRNGRTARSRVPLGASLHRVGIKSKRKSSFPSAREAWSHSIAPRIVYSNGVLYVQTYRQRRQRRVPMSESMLKGLLDRHIKTSFPDALLAGMLAGKPLEMSNGEAEKIIDDLENRSLGFDVP